VTVSVSLSVCDCVCLCVVYVCVWSVCSSSDELETSSCLYLQLYLLTSQPAGRCRYHLLLHVMLMRNCELSRLILSHSHDSAASVSQSEVTFFAVIDVLTRCTQFPSALSHALVPVCQQAGVVQIDLVKSASNHPMWLRAVIGQLEPFAARTVRPGIVRLMFNMKRRSPAADLVPMKQLPCGCQPACVVNAVSKPDLLTECIHGVMCQLVEGLSGLPSSLIVFFHTVQGSPHDNGDDAERSVGLKVPSDSVSSNINVCFSYIY